MKDTFIKNHYKNIMILIALISLTTIIFYSPYILTSRSLQYGTDIKTQWFQFYTEFKSLMSAFIHHKQLPFYSWNLFLGNNFFASKSYYLIGDIYSYISLLIPLPFFEMNMILQYIKFIVAGISFYCFLNEFEFKNITKIILSYVYVFNSWSIFFSGQLVFLSFYSILPFLFLGIEKILKNKNSKIFIIAAAILLCCNFYFFYTASIFIAIYCLYRYSILKFDFKQSFFYTIKLLLNYILSMGIVSIIFLPTFLYIKNTDRIFIFENIFFYKNLNVYLGFLHSLFTPNFLYIYRINVFETFEHSTREVCLWLGSTLCLLLPQLNQKIFKKYLNVKIYVVFIIIMFLPILSSAVHGFGDPQQRWLMFVNFFNLYHLGYVLDGIEQIDKKILKISLFTAFIFSLSSFFISLFYQSYLLQEYYWQLILILTSLSFFVLSYYVICRYKKFIMALIVFEVVFFGFLNYFISVDYKEGGSNKFIKQVTSVLEDEKNSLNNHLDYLNQNKEEFYRVAVDIHSAYWNYSHNMSVFYRLKGLMSYDSTYSYAINDLKKMHPEINEYSDWIFNIKDTSIQNFLSTKYFIYPNQYKVEPNLKLVDKDYLGAFNIYENSNYLPFGSTYTKVISMEEYAENPDTNKLLEFVIADKKDQEEIKSSVGNARIFLENTYYKYNHLHGEYSVNEDSFMILSLPYDDGWTIKVDNRIVLKKYKVNGGFIGIAVPSGEHSIDMYFVPDGFKLGAIISLISIIIFIVLQLKIGFKKIKHTIE